MAGVMWFGCGVFVGYDSENYYFADPLNSNGVVKYSKTKADIAFNSLGRQAVVIEKTLKSE
ncbi:MAG: hypothetical protein RR552_07375 [Oscillospiraceae bacterium]